MDAWAELENETERSLWDRFYEEFDFKPDYYERSVPAIREPNPSLVLDLSRDWDAESFDALNTHFLASFRTLLAPEEFLYVLDWQHMCYTFLPHVECESWPLSIYPDGDYYIFLSSDFTFGTFGHPWQQSLCVFGHTLIDALSDKLIAELGVIRRVGG